MMRQMTTDGVVISFIGWGDTVEIDTRVVTRDEADNERRRQRHSESTKGRATNQTSTNHAERSPIATQPSTTQVPSPLAQGCLWSVPRTPTYTHSAAHNCWDGMNFATVFCGGMNHSGLVQPSSQKRTNDEQQSDERVRSVHRERKTHTSKDSVEERGR